MTIKEFMRGHAGELVWIVAGYDAPGVKRGDVIYDGVTLETRVVGYEYNDTCHWWTVYVDNSITETENEFIQSFDELNAALTAALSAHTRSLNAESESGRVSWKSHVSLETLEEIRMKLKREMVIISMLLEGM